MNPVNAWLADRRPAPPRELSSRLHGAGPEGERVGGARGELVHRSLVARGLTALNEARRNPGRVRESAYQLLTADALLTYACEAALEAPDPLASLEKLVGRAASPDR